MTVFDGQSGRCSMQTIRDGGVIDDSGRRIVGRRNGSVGQCTGQQRSLSLHLVQRNRFGNQHVDTNERRQRKAVAAIGRDVGKAKVITDRARSTKCAADKRVFALQQICNSSVGRRVRREKGECECVHE